jgi:hypothetical protein
MKRLREPTKDQQARHPEYRRSARYGFRHGLETTKVESQASHGQLGLW